MERIALLLSQGKWQLAEQELRRHISEEIEDTEAHAYLGMCLLVQKKYPEAKHEIEESIRLSPTFAYSHYLLSQWYLDQGYPNKALAPNQEAIKLDPEDADYHTQLAAIYFQQSKWEESLESTEQALLLNPEHVDAYNLRARILIKLGRTPEASESFSASMQRDPQNSYTHSNRGWGLLEERQYKESLEHFRESLRLDPSNEAARQGLIEALKARYWIYRAYLNFAFFMSNLQNVPRWALVIGLVVIVNIIPFLLPVYLAFVFFSWFSPLIFNSLLQFNSFGRYALNEREKKFSILFIATLALGLATLIPGLLLPEALLEGIGVSALFLLFPIAGTFSKSQKRGRQRSAWFGFGLVGIALVHLVSLILGLAITPQIFTAFVAGVVIYTWATSFLE